eukprot:gene12113-15220_t
MNVGSLFGRAIQELELVLGRVDTSYVRGDVIAATKRKHADDTDEIKRALHLFAGCGHVPAPLMPRVRPLLPPVEDIAPLEDGALSYRSLESPSNDSLCEDTLEKQLFSLDEQFQISSSFARHIERTWLCNCSRVWQYNRALVDHSRVVHATPSIEKSSAILYSSHSQGFLNEHAELIVRIEVSTLEAPDTQVRSTAPLDREMHASQTDVTLR